jgi:hypothetical protein
VARAPKDPNAPAKVPTPAAQATASVKAKATAKVMRNPITGGAPNTYSQPTNQPLQPPSRVREFQGDPSEARAMSGQRKAHEASGGVQPDVGYRRPEGMSPHDSHWLMGQHRDRASQSVSDINVPHEVASGAIVTRRAEDLSGPEYRKGVAVLKHAGTTPEKVQQDMGGRMDRAAVSSVIASHPEHDSSTVTPHGERFYEGPSEPHDVISASAARVAQHPEFPKSGDSGKDVAHARQMMAMANSATSPNNPFAVNSDVGGKKTRVYPNNNAAESAVYAGLENKDAPKSKDVGKDLQKRGVPGVPAVGSGTYQSNMDKATNATAQMAQSGAQMHELRLPGSKSNPAGNQMFNSNKNPKTSSYVTAHAVDYAHPDESTVVDVHEGANAMPHLSTAKSVGFHQFDENGKQVNNSRGTTQVHFVHSDRMADVNKAPKSLSNSLPAGHTLRPAMVEDENANRNDGQRRVYGNSRVEEALSKGQPAIAPIVDRAARGAAAERGLSPSVNNATGTNRGQAARWYQQKIDRPNDPTKMSDYHSLQPYQGATHTAVGKSDGYGEAAHNWSGAAATHDSLQDAGLDRHASLHEAAQTSDFHPLAHQEVARGNTPHSTGSGAALFNDRRG